MYWKSVSRAFLKEFWRASLASEWRLGDFEVRNGLGKHQKISGCIGRDQSLLCLLSILQRVLEDNFYSWMQTWWLSSGWLGSSFLPKSFSFLCKGAIFAFSSPRKNMLVLTKNKLFLRICDLLQTRHKLRETHCICNQMLSQYCHILSCGMHKLLCSR